MFSSLPVLFALQCLTAVAWTTINPGLKVRISEKGLQYAATEAVEILAGDVKGQSLPDTCDDAHVPVVGHISYCVTGIKINSFATPTAAISTSPFHWSISNIGGNIQGDWKYHNHGFIHVSDHGSFDISLGGWSIGTNINLGMDANGRPTISSMNCQCQAGSVNIRLHGGASWLYNLFKGKIADAIQKSLTSQLCKTVDKEINEKGAAQLATLKVTVAIDKILTLDYSLVESPAFTTSYMESFHKGEIYWTGDTSKAPITAPPMNDIKTDKMVTIWLSEYVVNTLGYVTYKHQALHYNFTKDDLPENDKGALNTTCNGICIGNFVKALADKFPGATTILGIQINKPPTLNIDSSGLSGTFQGLVNFYVQTKNQGTKFAFSISSSIFINLTAAIVDTNVTANINNFTIGDLHLVNSAIGNIDVAPLQFIMKIAATRLLPKLNKLCQRGIVLPTIKGVQYVSPQLALTKNAIVVLTDVKYIG